MASLADELLADLEQEGEEVSAPPPQGHEEGDGNALDGDAGAFGHEGDQEHAAQDESELGLAHGAARPPEQMDQEMLDTMDFGKESVDSARSVSKLYGSDTLTELLNVRCAH